MLNLKYLIVVFLTISCNTFISAQKRYIVVDSTRFCIKTIGLETRQENQPVVVFENGMGQSLNTWEPILKDIARLCPVFTYDRAGIGESEDDVDLPSLKYNSSKLRKILLAADIKPPYILVGHSIGGTYIYGYAKYFPNDLAGLIFVDGGDCTQKWEEFKTPFKDIGLSERYVDSIMMAKIENANFIDSTKKIAIEQESMMIWNIRYNNFAEFDDLLLPKIPICVLVGGRFSVPVQYRSKVFNQEALFRARTKYWLISWANLINKSPYGRLFYSSKAGHYVQRDDPELVIESIRLAINDYNKLQKAE